MRLPLIATLAAAAVAVPLAVSAAGPQMSGEEFVQAVRCAAYAGPEAATERARLNVEAQRQPAETVQRAHNAVMRANAEGRAVANGADAGMMSGEQAAACAPAYVAMGAANRDAA